MVPPDWQPPTQWRQRFASGLAGLFEESPKLIQVLEFKPLCASYQAALDDYRANPEDWDDKPDPDLYMPEFAPGTATHLMMFETCTEGTPISPAFATPEELARWLADNNASAFGSRTATYEQWLAVCRGGWAPSAVVQGGRLMSGVEFAGGES